MVSNTRQKRTISENHTDNDRPFIVIAGMHRSGTSFLARALNLCGVYLGGIEGLDSGHTSNPKGHWENLRLVDLADKTLQLNGGSWDHIPDKISITESIGAEIKNTITDMFARPSLAYGFKDPRMAVCLESWEKYLPQNPIVVGIFRNPLKVAESLRIRNDFDYEKSIDLWRTYNLNMLNLLKRHHGFMLNFDWPKEKLLSEIQLITEKLGLIHNPAIAEWYSEDLLRSDKSYDNSYSLPHEIRSLYEELETASQKNQHYNHLNDNNISSTRLRTILGSLLTEMYEQTKYYTLTIESIRTSLKLNSDLHSTLFRIYTQRPDLQRSYPEVLQGNLIGLIKWALQLCSDKNLTREPEERKMLEAHMDLLEKYAQEFRISSEIEQLKNQILTLEQKLADRTNEIEVLNNARIDYNTKLDTYRALINQKEKTADDYRGALDNSLLEIENLKKDISDSKDAISRLNSQISQYTEKIRELDQTIMQYSQLVEKLQLINNERESMIKDLQLEISHHLSSIKNLESAKKQYSKLIEDLYALKSKYEASFQSLSTKNTYLEKRNSELQLAKEDLTKRLMEIESHHNDDLKRISELKGEISKRDKELENIKTSVSYALARSLAKKLDYAGPDGSRRGNLKKIAIESVKIIHREGWSSFLKHAGKKIGRGEFRILEPVVVTTERPPTQSINPADLPPFSPEQCEAWLRTYQPTISELDNMKDNLQKLRFKPMISICTPVYNPEQQFLVKAIQSVLDQIYSNWELILVDDGSIDPIVRTTLEDFANKDSRIKIWFKEKNEGISKTLNYAFSKAKGEYITILDNDDILEPHALYEVIQFLNKENADYNLIYTDEALIDDKDKATYIHFRPDFTFDFLLSHQYFVHMVIVKRSLISEVNGCDESFPNVSWDYDLWLRCTTRDLTKIGHIPKVLYRWRRYEKSTSTEAKGNVMDQGKIALSKCISTLGIDATVEDGLHFNYYRIKRKLRNEKLSIIIPSRNRFLIHRCIKSIEEKTKYPNYEIVIIGNNFKTLEDRQYFERLASKYKVLWYDKPYNFSEMNNFAARNCDGEHLLFLNDDTEILWQESIEAMLEHSQRPEVGAVGAKLLFPNDTFQHVGVVMGLFDSCEHIHKFHPHSLPTYYGSSHAIRNYSAVTAAAVMVPRRVFEKVGGFDEKMAIVFNDIDLCLRIRDAGYLVVYTPYSVMYHHEHASRKTNELPLHPQEEDLFFKQRWRRLIEYDPYFNPNLSRFHFDCRPSFDIKEYRRI